jgi:hypothetical protein
MIQSEIASPSKSFIFSEEDLRFLYHEIILKGQTNALKEVYFRQISETNTNLFDLHQQPC